ncbi:MAG: MFS transporter [Kiritimatiellae bacterium]|nr:MFS transporter [Kiritimatiellia bacterium]
MNSRRTAAFAVCRWRTTHEFTNELLPADCDDRAFVQDLVYTVVRRYRALRTVLGELMKKWPKGELEALVLVGAAQILYMPDVPDFAAVNETVAAAKASGREKRLDRVVNGVLRNLLRRRAELEAKLSSAPLATRESYPTALAKRWGVRYGAENAEALAKWHNQPAETWLAFKDGRFERLPHGRKVTDVEGFAEGASVVQDPATAGAVELLDVSSGCSVLDFCAAPGGKTAQIAWRLGGTGRLVAQEVNPKRLARLKQNLARLRLDSVEAVQSVSSIDDRTAFDRVLVDAPCSNTGVLRRRPDARWRWSAERLAQLVGLQAQLLDAAAALVAPGGRLVYSTCSNEPEENGEQVTAFLARHSDFVEVARRESVPFETGRDGAFACALERRRT